METKPEAGLEASRLDTLVDDFGAHVERLAHLGAGAASVEDVVAELRDNTYPSLLALAEELRDIDSEVAELVAPEPAIADEHVLALVAGLRAGRTLAESVRLFLPQFPEEGRETLEHDLERHDAALQVASAVLQHVVVVVGDDEAFGEEQGRG